MNSSFSVVCPDASSTIRAAIAALGPPAFPFIHYPAGPSADELIKRIAGHAAVLSDGTPIGEEILAACTDLKLIVFLGTGADFYIDRAACRRRQVRLETIAHYGDRTVAEHTLALIFAVYRDLGSQHLAMRTGRWRANPIGEITGKTLGVIGLGGVGGELARMAAALGMNVIGWSRRIQSASPCRQVDLDELLGSADIVSIHLALMQETEGFLNKKRLRSMRRGAVLINTARAALVDEAELLAMLADGHLYGAAIDVYQVEPLPPDAPLRRAPNVVLSCHSAWQSPEAAQNLIKLAFERIAAILA